MRTTVKYTDYKRFHTNVTIKYDGQEIEKDTPAPATPPKP